MDGLLWIWDTKELLAARQGRLPHHWQAEVFPFRMTALEFSSTETKLAVATWNGSIHVYQRVRTPVIAVSLPAVQLTSCSFG